MFLLVIIWCNQNLLQHYSKVDCDQLQYTLTSWGLGCLLLTGGYCLEVAVYTGLTVLEKIVFAGHPWDLKNMVVMQRVVKKNISGK
jgi:hypothetical protein